MEVSELMWGLYGMSSSCQLNLCLFVFGTSAKGTAIHFRSVSVFFLFYTNEYGFCILLTWEHSLVAVFYHSRELGRGGLASD